MYYVIRDTRNGNYLTNENCAHTRRGFSIEFVFGRWIDAMRITSRTEAHAAAVTMWPIGAMQATPYEVEEIA